MSIPPLPDGLDLLNTDLGPFRELCDETADLFLHDLSPLGRLFGPHAPPVANMVASDQDITGEEAADWEECFYRLIVQGKSVYKALVGEFHAAPLGVPSPPPRRPRRQPVAASRPSLSVGLLQDTAHHGAL